MSAHLRATFLNPPPGSDWPEDGEKEMKESLEVGDEGEKEALKRFAVLVLEPEVVDWSRTNVSLSFILDLDREEEEKEKYWRVVDLGLIFRRRNLLLDMSSRGTTRGTGRRGRSLLRE